MNLLIVIKKTHLHDSEWEDENILNTLQCTNTGTLHTQSTQYKQETAKKIRSLEKDTTNMSSYKEKIEVLEARALELEESNSELKDAVDTGAAYVLFE